MSTRGELTKKECDKKMFQNISNAEINNDNIEENIENKGINIFRLKNMFSIQNIILYIVALAVSTVSFNGVLAPFALAMFAACMRK